jgi:hypothetical protein
VHYLYSYLAFIHYCTASCLFYLKHPLAMPYLKFVFTLISVFLFINSHFFFKLLDEKKLQETKNLYADFESPEKAANV